MFPASFSEDVATNSLDNIVFYVKFVELSIVLENFYD